MIKPSVTAIQPFNTPPGVSAPFVGNLNKQQLHFPHLGKATVAHLRAAFSQSPYAVFPFLGEQQQLPADTKKTPAGITYELNRVTNVHRFECAHHHELGEAKTTFDFQIKFADLKKLFKLGRRSDVYCIAPTMRAALDWVVNAERLKRDEDEVSLNDVFLNSHLSFSIVLSTPRPTYYLECSRINDVTSELRNYASNIRVNTTSDGSNGNEEFRVERNFVTGRQLSARMNLDDLAWELLHTLRADAPDFFTVTHTLMAFFRQVKSQTSLSANDIATKMRDKLTYAASIQAVKLYKKEWYKPFIASMSPQYVRDFGEAWRAVVVRKDYLQIAKLDPNAMHIELEQAYLEASVSLSAANVARELEAKSKVGKI